MTRRKQRRIEAATAEHVADMQRIGRPTIREQVDRMRAAGEAQWEAWGTYVQNITHPAFVGPAVTR